MADTTFLEWPFFEARHRALAEQLDEFARTRLAEPGARRERRCGARSRLPGDRAPARRGGIPEPVLHRRARREVRRPQSRALARDAGPAWRAADFCFAMQGLGTGPISLFGTEAQKRKYLPPVMRGKSIAAFALSEPQAGSDVSAIATAATRSGNDYLLSGTKTWISNGGLADHYVVFARTGEGPGSKGLSAFIVDADAQGLKVGERIALIAPHPLATLTFKECRVPVSARLGVSGEGFKIAMATLDVFRTTVGAAALGFARRALDEALARCRERAVFGKPLA
jgi:acyl-CoA dehydrogenase